MIEGISAHHHQPNADEIARQRAARFQKTDSDGNGILTADEIETLVNNIGEKTSHSMNLEKFTAALDHDGNGEVTAEEFANLQRPGSGPHLPKLPWGMRPPGEAPHHGERFFDKLDADQSGDISESEIGDWLGRINTRTGKDLKTEDVMAKLDKNEDGVVTKDELRSMRRIMGPPPHKDWHLRHGMNTSDAIKNYAETSVAESDLENAPPTIVVPV